MLVDEQVHLALPGPGLALGLGRVEDDLEVAVLDRVRLGAHLHLGVSPAVPRSQLARRDVRHALAVEELQLAREVGGLAKGVALQPDLGAHAADADVQGADEARADGGEVRAGPRGPRPPVRGDAQGGQVLVQAAAVGAALLLAVDGLSTPVQQCFKQ